MSDPLHFDVLVLGSGPAGQKAAIQASKAGRSAAVVEKEPGVGGACVHQGTIPSKTLRESAMQVWRVRQHAALLGNTLEPREIEVASLMTRLDQVVRAHTDYMKAQLERNKVALFHGRASFISDREVEVLSVAGKVTRLTADFIVIATGSRPRNPPEAPVDHENVLDSDSILSMLYLPSSMVVLGSGVISCEYASIFAHLGVKVVLVDKADRPLKFMDEDLVAGFVRTLVRLGGEYRGQQTVSSVTWDGSSQVITTLKSGEQLLSDKVLVALGRSANVEELRLGGAGLTTNPRGLLEVDAHCRTSVPHIYAVGDVIGPPALAATAMEQGRRAVCHALQLPPGAASTTIPIGIYTLPEMASVGLGAAEAARLPGGSLVGRARFDEVARGQIAGTQDGLLKLVSDGQGERLLGVHIVGEGATELVHLGQMALLTSATIDSFVETIFNFPTMAEAYRIAALDVVKQRRALRLVPPVAA